MSGIPGQTPRSRSHHGRSLAEWMARIDERNAKIEAAPHYVYRAFDSYGHLLYIGCSLNVEARLAAHRGTSLWHRYAETVGISGPYSKDEARRLEAEAISSEASYFNATAADTRRTQANRVAARHLAGSRYGDSPDYEVIDRIRKALRDSGRYPYLTDRDRLARYMAAREAASLAMEASA